MPAPACNTHPRMTSPTSSFATPARAIASRTTTAPSCAALMSLSAPPNEPIAVRHALRMTTSKSLFKAPYLVCDDQPRPGRRLHGVDGGPGGNLAQQQTVRRDVDDR